MFRSMFVMNRSVGKSVLANLVCEPLDTRKWRECRKLAFCELAKFTLATMLGTIAVKRHCKRGFALGSRR